MQSVYLQRIMKKNADRGPKKTNPISEMAKMNANAFSQKDYENETAFGLKKTNPNKPNLETTIIGISKANRYLANGRVSGTTFIWVVNVKGIGPPLSKVSSTKKAVQPFFGSATLATYLLAP